MFEQMKRLVKHSAIYGLGGVLSRILAVLLLPLYTRYLSPRDYGAIETLVALVVVLMSVLRAGIASAFFRFYFDSDDEAYRVRVVRTSFWFTMATATAGLVVGLALAAPIGHALFGHHGHVNLVRAAFVGLWAQINYDQLTSLFRVEERSVSFVLWNAPHHPRRCALSSTEWCITTRPPSCEPRTGVHIGTLLRSYEPRGALSCGSPMPRAERIAKPAERSTRLVGLFFPGCGFSGWVATI